MPRKSFILQPKLWILLTLFSVNTIFAGNINHTLSTKTESNAVVELVSHSFNAHKRSTFSFLGTTESLERGLTIVHFKKDNEVEFKTFDTYGSKEDAVEFEKVLRKIIENQSVFAILAHDSAAASLGAVLGDLKEIGLIQLSNLKGRQAYLMQNFDGSIKELVDDTTISKTYTLPNNINDSYEYFPKIKYEFEPNNNRFIAHAGGEIDGVKSTNTKNALDQNYKKGFRLFELDIIETSDGKLVAAHDWKMWARFTDYTGSLPPTHEEFMKHKIYGDYTTLDMAGINNWFKQHPDAILITDKVNDPIGFAHDFVDSNRLIMELFSIMAVEEASSQGIHTMISQEPLLAIKGDKLNFLKVNNVKYVALSRRIIASQTKLMLQLKEAGIKVYVYNVNFDPGKDEQYVLDNEIGLVYGMYADKWVFDTKPKEVSK